MAVTVCMGVKDGGGGGGLYALAFFLFGIEGIALLTKTQVI